jgi:hypothetical protein
MGRRRQAGDSSLDLLLDTITNTFGGILFLAILVSLLLRTTSATQGERTSQKQPPLEVADQVAFEVKLEDLQDQLARLQARLAGQKAEVETPKSANDEEADKLEAELAGALGRRAAVYLETAEYQRTHDAAQGEILQLDQRREVAAGKVAAATRDRERVTEEAEDLAKLRVSLEQRAKRSAIEQTAGMPTIHDTDKQQVAIYVRFGRIFMMHSWRNGERQGPNPTFFVVSPGEPPVARPKPDCGIAIDPESIGSKIRELLRGFPPSRWVVAMVVFSDSFDVFQLVKRAVVEEGYEYLPMPLKPGESVLDSGGDSIAQ